MCMCNAHMFNKEINEKKKKMGIMKENFDLIVFILVFIIDK